MKRRRPLQITRRHKLAPFDINFADFIARMQLLLRIFFNPLLISFAVGWLLFIFSILRVSYMVCVCVCDYIFARARVLVCQQFIAMFIIIVLIIILLIRVVIWWWGFGCCCCLLVVVVDCDGNSLVVVVMMVLMVLIRSVQLFVCVCQLQQRIVYYKSARLNQWIVFLECL